jgi:hypothetical protein
VQACSWAGPNVEVIVRDNSGDAQKRDLLGRFKRDHCNIIHTEPCDGLTNFSEILRLAKGEFVFMLADDDYCFDQAIAALPPILGAVGADRSVAGVTGAYVVETAQGSGIAKYENAESDDVVARVAGFLGYNGPNILHYAPVRREIIQRIFALMNDLPCYLSFHDQITCLLYLLSGKFIRLNRLLYAYDMGVWQSAETAQKKDTDFYTAAGLDPAVNKLHWFLCGFEGATLILNSDAFPDHPRAQRQAMADRWFATMFTRFKHNPRLTYGSPWTQDADRLCAKLQASTGQLSFQTMLAEISTFIGLFSRERAQRYFEFWNATINRRKPAQRQTGS